MATGSDVDLGVDLSVDLSRAHFIGVGGVGMSGLAKILTARQAKVSGSDAKDSQMLAALRARGCEIHVGHAASNLGDASCVVVSSAIRQNNPELVAARERGIPVIHRADALAYLMAGRRAVTVAGTHGKTTTTSMLAVSFQKLGLDPSYAIGADLNEAGSNAHHGSGDLFVAEADESDRSFHKYSPAAAIILNVEMDHHDHYASLDEVIAAYEEFAHRIIPGGVLALSADDPGARTLAVNLARSAPGLRILTYGESDQADVAILKVEPRGLTSEVTIRAPGVDELRFTVSVPGRHNAHNATGALTVGYGLGYPLADLADAIPAFIGVRRRFQLKGEAAGVTVVDCYAHHPTEMAADIATARQAVGSTGRVIVVYQPHLFTRTRALGEDMGKALAAADVAVVMDIYAAREDPIPGVTSHIVALSALDNGAMVRMEHRWTAVPAAVAKLVRPGDLVLTMGAGDVTLLGPEILSELDPHAAAATG